MSLSDLRSRLAVLQAVEAFDRLGQDDFLRKYRFGRAQSYFLEHEGKRYDSKAIVGAAHGYQFAGQPLRARDFSGGERTVRAKLEELGFTVVVLRTAPGRGGKSTSADSGGVRVSSDQPAESRRSPESAADIER